MNSVAIAIIIMLGVVGGGCGAALTTNTEERESGMMYIWKQRGADAGSLARAYCVMGSIHEREVMDDALLQRAYPAKVTIKCPGDADYKK